MSVYHALSILVLATISNVSATHFYNTTSSLNSPELFASKIEQFLKSDASSRISTTCTSHLDEYLRSLKSMKFWALSMLDAGGKLPSGLLNGHIISLGGFNQCLDIEEVTDAGIIQGKYCLGLVILAEKIPVLGLGTCAPRSCSAEDLQEFYKNVLGATVVVAEATCQSKEDAPELDNYAIGAIWFFSVIFGIMIVSTAYDIIIQYLGRKPVHRIALAFSVLTNGRNLFKINVPGQIRCLYGIRSITLFWVIIVHQYGRIPTTPAVNTLDIAKIFTNTAYMFYHSGAPVVDTFFFMGGIVISYNFMNNQRKGVAFNLPLFYVHRYLRLTPIYAGVMLIIAAFFPYFGSGPLYHLIVDSHMKYCRDYWWSALLYVQNFVNPAEICNGATWYLSTEMQLFIFAPILLFGMKKRPKLTFCIMGLLIILMSMAGFLIVWFYEFHAFWNGNLFMGFTSKMYEYSEKYYYMPYIRGTPWMFGLILGYMLSDVRYKKPIYKFNLIVVYALWIIALGLLATLIYGTKDLMYEEYVRLNHSIYAATFRIGWSLSLMWIIYACATGYGGVVNWFLSLPIFEVISRLVYSAYLIHYVYLFVMQGNVKTNIHFSNLYEMHRFWAHTFFSLGTGVILTLALEYPIPIIEKTLFGRFEGKVVKKQNVVEDKTKEK